MAKEAEKRIDELVRSKWALAAPPPRVMPSEWVGLHRYLPPGASPRAGAFQPTPYQRQMMDCIREPGIEEFVFMTSTQVGKSEVLNSLIAYFIAEQPAPMMLVQPSTETARDYSKMRIQPMIEHTPILHAKVREKKSRQPGNEIRLKEFDGGFLKITGANSGPGLRSHSVAKLFFDEVDAYQDELPGEGSPIELARRRTDAFGLQRLIGYTSTPKKPKGLSQIEGAWLRSDQRHYYVPCPLCGAMQWLQWRTGREDYRLRWEKDSAGRPIPESVRYLCEHCDGEIEEKYKGQMLGAGGWVKHKPENIGVAGFHLNALYSPWESTWGRLAAEWHDAHQTREGLREFVNLRLGETFEESPDAAIEGHTLMARVESFAASPEAGEEQPLLPEGVVVLVAAADVQHNRIEAQIIGFGVGEEAWVLAYEIFWGNPGIGGADPASGLDVWAAFDSFRLKTWKHPSGATLAPGLTLVDSGFHSGAVYNYVMPRQATRRPALASKGVDRLSRPGLVQESPVRKHNIRLILIASAAGKDKLFARLALQKPGAGYVHFSDSLPPDYFDQLTSERRVPVRNKYRRTTRSVWVKTQERNEALDLMVYSFGALATLQLIAPRYRNLARVATSLGKPTESKPAGEPRARSSWMDWRGESSPGPPRSRWPSP